MSHKFFLVLACALVVFACGGEDSEFAVTPVAGQAAIPEVAGVGGVWNGSVVGLPGDSGGRLFGVSASDGRFRFVELNSGAQFAGILTITGDSIVSGTGKAASPLGKTWSDNSLITDFEVASGTISNRRSMFFFWETVSGDAGEISVVYDASHELSSSIEALEGMWTELDEDSIPSLVVTFDEAGSLNGQSGEGCVYGGMVSIIDPDLNVYDLSITISSCGGIDGSYQGLGTIIQSGFDQVFIIQADSGDNFLFMELTSDR